MRSTGYNQTQEEAYEAASGPKQTIRRLAQNRVAVTNRLKKFWVCNFKLIVDRAAFEQILAAGRKLDVRDVKRLHGVKAEMASKNFQEKQALFDFLRNHLSVLCTLPPTLTQKYRENPEQAGQTLKSVVRFALAMKNGCTAVEAMRTVEVNKLRSYVKKILEKDWTALSKCDKQKLLLKRPIELAPVLSKSVSLVAAGTSYTKFANEDHSKLPEDLVSDVCQVIEEGFAVSVPLRPQNERCKLACRSQALQIKRGIPWTNQHTVDVIHAASKVATLNYACNQVADEAMSYPAIFGGYYGDIWDVSLRLQEDASLSKKEARPPLRAKYALVMLGDMPLVEAVLATSTCAMIYGASNVIYVGDTTAPPPPATVSCCSLFLEAHERKLVSCLPQTKWTGVMRAQFIVQRNVTICDKFTAGGRLKAEIVRENALEGMLVQVQDVDAGACGKQSKAIYSAARVKMRYEKAAGTEYKIAVTLKGVHNSDTLRAGPLYDSKDEPLKLECKSIMLLNNCSPRAYIGPTLENILLRVAEVGCSAATIVKDIVAALRISREIFVPDEDTVERIERAWSSVYGRE